MPVYVGIDPGFDDDCALAVVAWDAISGAIPDGRRLLESTSGS